MEIQFIVLFVCYASYAYNRNSVAFATPKLIEEGLDAHYAGLIRSCQNTAFAGSKFLVGVLSDRINPYVLFAIGLLASGLTTIIFSTSSSISVFCCLWFFNGLAQGCGWPSCAKILRQKATPSQFGTWWSLLSSSYNISSSLAPFLSAFIILNYGWRASVLFAGSISVLMGIWFLLFSVASSASIQPQPSLSAASEDRKTEKHETIHYLLSDPFMWLLSLCFMTVFCAKSTAIDWGQVYLIDEKNQSQYVASAFTSSVESGGFLGRIAAGFLTDCIIRASKSNQQCKPNLRLKVAVILMLGNLMFIHLLQVTVSETSSTIWIIFIGFALGMNFYGCIVLFQIAASESAPPHLSGSANAIVSLAGNVRQRSSTTLIHKHTCEYQELDDSTQHDVSIRSLAIKHNTTDGDRWMMEEKKLVCSIE